MFYPGIDLGQRRDHTAIAVLERDLGAELELDVGLGAFGLLDDAMDLMLVEGGLVLAVAERLLQHLALQLDRRRALDVAPRPGCA